MDRTFSAHIQSRIDNKTKPVGSLGQLEQVALQLALIQSQGKTHPVDIINLTRPTMLVFAGDHGIAQEGVSIAPSAVTQQMVANFLTGGAAINCFCRASDIELKVIDCGMLAPIETLNPTLKAHPALVEQRLGTGCANFSQQAAMSTTQVEQGLAFGEQLAADTIASGCNLLMFGEMGIGNTSSAAALLAALSRSEVEQCVGRGTGINAGQLQLKLELVSKAVARCGELSVTETLAEVGGYDIVQMVGAFLAARRHKVPVLVDGFIVSVAAYVATLLEAETRDYLIFAHRSQESGHKLVLELLRAEPLLDLGLRLGEGTGAALAFPLLKAAARFYNQMASFDSAGVTV